MNHKMKKSHPEHISWFLMMSPDVLRRYTSHNMENDPNNVTAGIPGSATHSPEAFAQEAAKQGYMGVTAGRVHSILDALQVNMTGFLRLEQSAIIGTVASTFEGQHLAAVRDGIVQAHRTMRARRGVAAVPTEEFLQEHMESLRIPVADQRAIANPAALRGAWAAALANPAALRAACAGARAP